MRVIGVELRLRYFSPRHGQQQQEVLLLPCNVLIEVEDPSIQMQPYGPQPSFNGTLHTDAGDFNFEIQGIQSYQILDTKKGLKVDGR